MSAVILRFPISEERIAAARGALAVARYRFRRVCGELDAREPANWGAYELARERLDEAEERMRGMICREA